MSTEMSFECSPEAFSFIYLDVVDGMNVLHRFFDDFSRLNKSEEEWERHERFAAVPAGYPDEDQ
jgi:hypothetical protein